MCSFFMFALIEKIIYSSLYKPWEKVTAYTTNLRWLITGSYPSEALALSSLGIQEEGALLAKPVE